MSTIVLIPDPHVEIGEFRVSADGRTHVQCRTCGHAVSHGQPDMVVLDCQ